MRIAVFNDTSVTRHHGCTAVMVALLGALQARGAQVPYRWPVAKDWQPHADDLAARDIDALVINGEGSIHHSADRPRTRHLCALGPFARDRLGVPAYLLNATMEALEPEALDHLRAFTLITVRETRTQDYLARHGIDAQVAGDLSLSTTPPAPVDRNGVLVTDSVLRDTRKQLEAAAGNQGARFERMRHRPGPIARLIAKWRTDPLPLTGPMDPRLKDDLSAFVSRIARHEILVTGRFHSVCLGLLTRTPLFALSSNTGKISAVLSDALGDDARVIGPEALSDFDALRSRAAYSERDLQRIGLYIETSRAVQDTVFDRICGT